VLFVEIPVELFQNSIAGRAVKKIPEPKFNFTHRNGKKKIKTVVARRKTKQSGIRPDLCVFCAVKVRKKAIGFNYFLHFMVSNFFGHFFYLGCRLLFILPEFVVVKWQITTIYHYTAGIIQIWMYSATTSAIEQRPF